MKSVIDALFSGRLKPENIDLLVIGNAVDVAMGMLICVSMCALGYPISTPMDM